MKIKELLKGWIEYEKREKRSGDPIIDTFRELNRHLSCKCTEGGSLKITSNQIRRQSLERFEKLFSDTS